MLPQRVLLAWALLAAIAAAEEPRPPNIVYIVSDDQGYRDLGCFGGDEIQTPQLDRLAKEGVRLTSFYVTWPACTPSRGSLLTGRYPQRNGLYDMIRNDMVNYGHKFTEAEYAVSPEMTLGLDLREVTIADVLKEAGYATGMIGKWDSGRAKRFLPTSRGFDSFYGFANTGIDYWTHERYGIPSLFRGTERIKEEGYATDLFRREAVAFVKQHAGQPFFLYLAFNAPHSASNLEKDSYQVPADVLKRYSNHDPKQNRTKYMAMVTRMDDAIGELLDTLRELKLENNTLVIFHSDNGGGGPADNGVLRGRKATMWEGGLRVPGIVRWPGHTQPGSTSDEPVCGVDLLPTIFAITGTDPPADRTLDGASFLPVLTGRPVARTRPLYWQFNYAQSRPKVAIRAGDWKLLAGLTLPDFPPGADITDEQMQALKSAELTGFELYNLRDDIGETTDLAAREPQKLAEMTAQMQELYRSVRDESPVWPAWTWPREEAGRIEWPEYRRPRGGAGNR